MLEKNFDSFENYSAVKGRFFQRAKLQTFSNCVRFIFTICHFLVKKRKIKR
jgi:hypothetical protein